MNSTAAILIGAFLATAGWLFTGYRLRVLARKQYTITAMMQANFNEAFFAYRIEIAPYIRHGACPKDMRDGDYEELRAAFRFILNHYEFMCAGLRNGDFDEKLIKDSERGTYIALYECCNSYIWDLRTSRERMTVYEHLEWVYWRWKNPPRWAGRMIEFALGRPGFSRQPKALASQPDKR